MYGDTSIDKSQPEQAAQNEEDNLLDRYESDSSDYRPCLDLEDGHPFNMMSHTLGREMLKENIKLIEFREGMMFKNFREIALALKDFCIQEGFRPGGSSLREKRIICDYYADKCPFRVYAILQN